MLPKLTKFYKECIAPEIVRNNIGKGQKCIDPPFITDAIKVHAENKATKARKKLELQNKNKNKNEPIQVIE